jgi:hypothetical protein
VKPLDLAGVEPILLGDNQFFGVNHLSPEKGRAMEERFKDISEVKKIMYYAIDNGVNAVFFSTHPLVYQITDMMRADPDLKKMSVYVNIPYISKYVRMLSEKGMERTIRTMLLGEKGLMRKMAFIMRGGISLARGNYLDLANCLVDVEMGPFYDLNVKAIFLHDALTGLAIGYDMVNVIKNFYQYIRRRYQVIPAFGTLNYPLMADILKRAEIGRTLVMCAVNKKGYFMNPNKQASEEEFSKHSHSILAMSTLAAGSLKPEEAYEYIASLGTVKHIVVGLSSKEHADETFRIARKYFAKV